MKKYDLEIIKELKALPKEEIAKILSTMRPRLRDVLRLRFNIFVNGDVELNGERIAELMGKSKQNISQAISQALASLRNPLRYNMIKKAGKLEN